MFAALYAQGNLPFLLECARRFSPSIEIASPDVVVLDLRGLHRLFGSAENIAKEIERTVGLPANIAIASNPDAAIYASRRVAGTTLIAQGRESEALAPLSLHLLGCPSEMGEVLDLWGLRTFGQFAQLPPLGVAARLGEEGLYWQQQAQGAVKRQLRLVSEVPSFRKELVLDDPVSTLEPLLFLLGQLLFELCTELAARSLATNEMRVTMRLEKEPEQLITIRLPVPMSDRKALLKLLHCELEQHPARAPVRAVRLELEPAAPKTTQEHLFTPAYPLPEQIELTIARIRRFVGTENIGTPVLLDTYKPDGFAMKAFAPSAQSEIEERRTTIPLAFRRFRPPQPAQVKTECRPVYLSSIVATGSVSSARGPWYSSGHWWQQDAWHREEWDIGLQSGALYKIFCDLKTNSWFIEGNYD